MTWASNQRIFVLTTLADKTHLSTSHVSAKIPKWVPCSRWRGMSVYDFVKSTRKVRARQTTKKSNMATASVAMAPYLPITKGCHAHAGVSMPVCRIRLSHCWKCETAIASNAKTNMVTTGWPWNPAERLPSQSARKIRKAIRLGASNRPNRLLAWVRFAQRSMNP